MPAIRRLLLPRLLAAGSLLALSTMPLRAQTLASNPDTLPVQAPAGSPPTTAAPPASSTSPQQTRPVEGQSPAQSLPAPGRNCTPTRPTS